MLTFQILDAYAQDLQIQSETETSREVAFVEVESDEDAEVISRRKKSKSATPSTGFQRRMIIHLFGTTADGKTVRTNIEGFEPFFYVRLPFSSKDTQRAFQERVELMVRISKDFCLKRKDGKLDFEISFCKRKVLFGYNGGKEFPFACLKVKSIAAWRTLRSYFLSKDNRPSFNLYKDDDPLKVYEANLDPMLRFFHIRNLQPCGWVTVDTDDVAEDNSYDIDYEQISRCPNPPIAVAPFCIASWDIECYSENGEFPLPKKGYDRTAKLLLQNARDGARASFLLLQAILYPESPPDELDPIRHRNGRPANRKNVEELLNRESFQADMDEALKSSSARDDKIKEILAVLKPLEKIVPIAGDPVIQIGVVLQRGTEPLMKHIFVLDTCDPIEGATVHAFGSEREMIIGWAKAMASWDTDILMGYNVFGFDERYLWQRAEELGITEDAAIQNLTRLVDTGKKVTLDEKFLSSSALGDNMMYIWSAHGRLQIDLYNYVKRSFALGTYKLDDVCQHFMSGSLSSVDCADPTKWVLSTKTTSDVSPGRYVVLLDETGDALVDKLKVIEVISKSAIIVEAPTGDDAGDLAISTASAMKWAVVKDDVSPQEIFKLHRTNSAGRARVGAYCIQDCMLVLELYKKLDVFNNAMAMANACSVPVAYIFTRGQGVKIESLIFKECHERKQAIEVLPSPGGNLSGPGAPQESYEGAIVLDPIPGFYFDEPVGVADFASLYPSTIISENISYDTLAWVKNFKLNGEFDSYAFGSEENESFAGPDVRWTDISFDIWGSDPEDTRKHPAKIKTGLRICRYAQFPNNGKGALPDIVQKLLAARKAKRKEAEKEQDPFKKALLDAEQLAYKLTANSLYGQLGSTTFKISLQHLAASVTAYGRKQILFAKATIEQFYGPTAGDPRCSAVMVYGDTDSLFVNFKPKGEDGQPLTGKAALEATMALTEEAGKFVTRCLKPPHDFEYDKVFAPFIIFSKKRYVGNKYEDSVESYYQTSMGIATKRRDYAPIVKLIYGGALRILLTQKDIAGAVAFVKEKLNELVEGKMSLNMLTMSKSLRAEYATMSPPAHKVLAERIKGRDPGNAPASGERVQFIYVLPRPGQPAPKLQGDRVETPAWIRAKGLLPDYRFYIEHQLMNPIVQLFALVADKIPGVVMPRTGWETATDVMREMATTTAIFQPTLDKCDRSAVNRFGLKFFGVAASPAPMPTEKSSIGTGKPVADKAKPAVQTNLSSYFMDKMIVKAIDNSKKKGRVAVTPLRAGGELSLSP